ncbi:MAG TPA: PAS domain S-box protein, partial [Anaeromyxobacter sp.]
MRVPAGREIPLRRRSALRASGFPALTTLVVVACIGVVGALYVRSERRLLRDQAEAQLAAMADLEVSQIEAWRGERLADGRAFSGLFAPRLAALRGRPSALLGELGPSLRLLTASYGYADALVVDLSGRPLATAGAAEPPPPIDAAERLGIALRRGALLFEVMGEGPAGLEIDLVAPIFDPDRPGVPLGGLVLRIDPRHDLFPMVKRWPTPSETGESLLVRNDGDHVATLNEPRHRTPTAAPLAPPLDDPRHPAVRIVRGEQGLVRGIDYRGEEVLAVGRAVPRTPWFVVAKVDVRELMAPARAWSIALGAVVLLLIGSGVGAVALWWRHQSALGERARFLEAQRYQAFTRHLELLSEHADDVVLLVDRAGRIVRANERAREQYGWSAMELVGLDLRVLRARGHESFQDQLDRIRAEGRARYETVHRRRDGSTFPVEVSARSFEAEGGWYVQAIVRDATERKRALAELSYQAELLRNVYDAIIGLDADHVIRSWNAGAERMYGIGAAEAMGRPIAELLPSEYEGYGTWDDFVDAVNAGDRLQFEVRRTLRDGRELDVEGAAVVLRDARGRITGYVTIHRDVTERRRAREQLLHSRKMQAAGQLASGVAHDPAGG